MSGKTEASKKKARKGKLDGLEEYENTIATLQKEIHRTDEVANLVDTRFTQSLTFWEIAKNRILELDKEFRNVVFMLDSYKYEQMSEIEKYKVQMRHALNETQEKYGQLKTLLLANKREMIGKFEDDLMLFRDENQTLKCKMRETERQNAEFIKSLHLHFQEEQSKKEQDLCNKIEAVEARSKGALEKLRVELEAAKHRELNDMEEKHGLRVRDLISNHEMEMIRMRHYFNEITNNSVGLIRTLELKLKNLESKLNESLKKEKDTCLENAALTESNRELVKQSISLKKCENLLNRERKTNELNALERQKICKENMILKNKLYALSERMEKVENLEKVYTKAMSRVQQQCGMMNHLLSKKFNLVSDNLETREMQMLCLISALKNDEATAEIIKIAKDHIQGILQKKNATITELKMRMKFESLDRSSERKKYLESDQTAPSLMPSLMAKFDHYTNN